MGDNLEIFFLGGIVSDEEFDEFVSEVLYVEPPPSLVNAILSSVSQIPLSEMQPELPEQADELTEEDAARFA